MPDRGVSQTELIAQLGFACLLRGSLDLVVAADMQNIWDEFRQRLNPVTLAGFDHASRVDCRLDPLCPQTPYNQGSVCARNAQCAVNFLCALCCALNLTHSLRKRGVL